MNKFLKITAFLGSLVLLSSLHAEEWIPVGAKGLGTSGAQVANPEGSAAMLANPAALGKKQMNRFDLSLPITLTVGSKGDLITNVDQLLDKYESNGVETALDRLEGDSGATSFGTDVATVSNFLVNDAQVLDQPGQGVAVQVQGHLTARVGRLGVAVGTRSFAGGTVNYDSNFSFQSGAFSSNDSTAIQTEANAFAATGQTLADAQTINAATQNNTSKLSDDEIGYYVDSINGASNRALTAAEINFLTALTDGVNSGLSGATATAGTAGQTSIVNDSGVSVRGLVTQEAAVSYAFSFKEDRLHVAPTLKFIQGETYTTSVRLTDGNDENFEDKLTEDQNTTKTTTFSLDIGVLYQVDDRWSVGLVGRDLNTPSFDLAGGQDIELEPSIRVGTAYEYSVKPGWRGYAEFDADLLANESGIVVGSKSRQIALGVNQELMGFLSLRAGASKDLESESDGISYSAGLGVQLYRFYFDVAGAFASDEVTIDGDDFPTRGGFGITLGWNNNF